ncbi:MAG: ergothioneine biosynthesis protein EgtB [Xanthomonadales bacterium]|nr:ergothioneine biosynthesis protein EgtB [Xanthomonadales bacterium]
MSSSSSSVQVGALDFTDVRTASSRLVAPLCAEDATVQSMPETSPSKWHLAHTTWFFEEFVLSRTPGYQRFNVHYGYLFNSYYQSVGSMHARPARGLLTRPTLAEVMSYREAVDEAMLMLLARGVDIGTAARIQLGLHHEQQHQELILTDIKHLLSRHPLAPAYREDLVRWTGTPRSEQFAPGRQGVVAVGGDENAGFVFDCETPRHQALLHAHALANRPVSNREYLEFVRADGYARPEWWLSEGYALARAEDWRGPLYWDAGAEREFTLAGLREIDGDAPVCHVSYYEADAYARFRGARLPTEFEWEDAARDLAPNSGHDVGSEALQPMPATGDLGLQQMFGDVWEWAGSPYVPYPGFKPLPGALGEYNGKFMCGQWVLRGGSCVSPVGHLRASYRNFFYPRDRWQFSGIRLARDL